MRFDLMLELKNPVFYSDYRRYIISFIKKSLSLCKSQNLLEKFYKDVCTKDFGFNVILPKPCYEKELIKLADNKIKVSFSTDNRNKTGAYLMQSFIGMKHQKFPLPKGNEMELTKILSKKQEYIVSSKVLFRTSSGSGICVRHHDAQSNKDKYYTQADPDFQEQFLFIIQEQLRRAGFGQKDVMGMEARGLFERKVVAKYYDGYIDLNIGMFQLGGRSELIQYLYNVGVGSRHSSGFGMVDLISQDLI